ncbi:hypothetical protein PSEUBRA_002776 [Kalmanozyma brasiliensis GHG001]|uniref:uncharacterized protein n=1 Tax=Kalmanozyma brasiliensis (strain GHG001) TaxID=1365824 RepID=UPI002867D093|nr:uncharacterized protein PSEUBRA_002776 [Kalmanozyma brasiliensis GHG001]EST07681.2 hypothetical protein PSEUBRA_002776 [Kalmanozyma brasiliensis GHG001]
MHEARCLLSLYAKTIEPFGFGLPDFPASAELTPVILSAIACVASLHSPSSDLRARQLQLRADILDRTLPYAPTTAEDDFNPESGIGTEEVVGACIWSAYDGSEDAWKVARAARWWSEKYSYETGPHAGLTVGEMVAILPPVRHVSIHDRVRVWLTAFLAELHQCEIHDKVPIMQVVDPAQYSQALMAESSSGSMTKQDAVLVFYARVAFLIARARLECRNPEELVQMTRDLTASWCTTRALLATNPDRRDTYDHTLDLHYTLAKAHVLSRACRIYEERSAAMTAQDDVGMTTAAYVSRSQACQTACLDSLQLLLNPNAGFVGSLAALPSIYLFWIARCAVFLLELCRIDSLHHRLGLLVQGQSDDIVHTVGRFMQQYLTDLAACDTQITLPGQGDSEPVCEVMRHPAMEAALAVTDLLASVQATV